LRYKMHSASGRMRHDTAVRSQEISAESVSAYRLRSHP